MRDKFLKNVALFAQVIFALGGIYLVSHLIGIEAGIALAAVGGVVIPGQQSSTTTVKTQIPELDLASVSESVAKFAPSRFILDTMFRNGKLGLGGRVQKSKSLIKRFYGFNNILLNDRLSATGLTGENDGTTSATAVRSYTYTTGNGQTTKWIAVQNPDKWTPETLFIMRDLSVAPNRVVAASGLTDKEDVVFFVEEVASGAIKVRPINGIKGLNALSNTYVMPNFSYSTNVGLYKIGTAKSEKALLDTSMSYYPTPDINYCQYFIKTISESKFQQMQAKEVEWDIRDMLDIAIYNLRAEIEGSLLWGAQAEVTFNGELRYTMKGLTRFIDQFITYTGTGITKADMVNLFKIGFTGNNGSANKLLVAGADYLSKVMAFMLDNQTYMRTTIATEWGITFKKWETDFGIINVVHHPLLTEQGRSDYAYLLDMDYVNKAEFLPFTIEAIDKISAGLSNEIVYSLREVSTCWLDNPDCHFIIKPA